jgi:hypothetical protein
MVLSRMEWRHRDLRCRTCGLFDIHIPHGPFLCWFYFGCDRERAVLSLPEYLDRMGVFCRAREWDLNIDRYLNRVIPPSPLHKLPTPVSRFLGYRKETRQDVGNVLGAFWSLFGAVCGLAVIAAVFNNTASIQWHHPPALIASFVSFPTSRPW